MKGYQDTFKRYEEKYLLEEDKYFSLMKKIKEKMVIDGFGKTTICNIYFDTPEHRLIKRSLEKPVYKEKLRLRSYGTPGEGDPVYVELKKKYKGIVYKRREKMELLEAESYLYYNKPAVKRTQITNEIDWFIKTNHGLKPAMYISYDRTAMYGIEDPELRITFDSNILWRERELWLSCGIWGNPILEEGVMLMELKISRAIPLWLAHILDEYRLYPVSFSKYGRAYLQSSTLMNGTKPEGEIIYA